MRWTAADRRRYGIARRTRSRSAGRSWFTPTLRLPYDEEIVRISVAELI